MHVLLQTYTCGFVLLPAGQELDDSKIVACASDRTLAHSVKAACSSMQKYLGSLYCSCSCPQKCLTMQLQAFLAASLKNDEELLGWFNERLVWNDPAVVTEMLKNGLFVRIFAPQVLTRCILLCTDSHCHPKAQVLLRFSHCSSQKNLKRERKTQGNKGSLDAPQCSRC